MPAAAPSRLVWLALEAQQAADLRHFDAEWSDYRQHLGDQQTRAITSLHAMHAMTSFTAVNLEATAWGGLLHAHAQQRAAACQLAQPWPPPPLTPSTLRHSQQVKRAVDDFLDHVHVVPLWATAATLQFPDDVP
ncbi:Aste57867_16720 [Aphanomyces stellatus]|uniref:Aste57867_16720 protein n=1 Tax=Aphanomyces stellatus TaxID=120398 RepID=A0A485L803_9STRA|nr:hypothetical protein As57867_016663 [Aphanomyces stellatus]VFT93490.1 Aste57867_16720 [Aphanomyces stellatus]